MSEGVNHGYYMLGVFYILSGNRTKSDIQANSTTLLIATLNNDIFGKLDLFPQPSRFHSSSEGFSKTLENQGWYNTCWEVGRFSAL